MQQHTDAVYWRADGTSFPVEYVHAPIRERGGTVGSVITFQDITERKQAEVALRTSEERYRALVERSPMPIIADLDGRIVYINPAGARAFGATSPEEMIGLSVLDRIHPDDRVFTQTRIQQMQAGNDVGMIQERLVRLDGHVFDIEAVGIAIPYLDARANLVVFQDITERKQMERMKNEFISVVSHELRTPLTSIQGALGLLQGGVLGAFPLTAKPMLEVAYHNSQRLVRLVNDILDMEKIQAGQMQFNLAPVALLPLLEQALLANSAYAAALNVRFALAPLLPQVVVHADPDRLMQVLANLLSNAAKYSPPNEVVSIRLSRQPQSIRVSVADHGAGIPEAFRARVFEKFAQADASDTRQKGGTGLGLSISKAIIERLGGQIGFETESGVGTTFYFELPEYQEVGAAGPQAVPCLASTPSELF